LTSAPASEIDEVANLVASTTRGLVRVCDIAGSYRYSVSRRDSSAVKLSPRSPSCVFFDFPSRRKNSRSAISRTTVLPSSSNSLHIIINIKLLPVPADPTSTTSLRASSSDNISSRRRGKCDRIRMVSAAVLKNHPPGNVLRCGPASTVKHSATDSSVSLHLYDQRIKYSGEPFSSGLMASSAETGASTYCPFTNSQARARFALETSSSSQHLRVAWRPERNNRAQITQKQVKGRALGSKCMASHWPVQTSYNSNQTRSQETARTKQENHASRANTSNHCIKTRACMSSEVGPRMKKGLRTRSNETQSKYPLA